MLFRLLADNERERFWTQSNPFPDVVITDWFNNAVSTAVNAGIFAGMPDGTFQPNREITRAELVSAAVRFMGLAHQRVDSPMFSDIYGHWAFDAINTAADLGWIVGYNGLGGVFMPDQPITRAETVAIFNNMLGRLPQTTDDLLPNMVTWPDNANPHAWYYLHIQEATNSHRYVRKEDGIHETWTELIQTPDWSALERPTSELDDVLIQE